MGSMRRNSTKPCRTKAVDASNPLAPSTAANERYPLPSELTLSEIKRVQDSFVQAAQRAAGRHR